MTSLHWFIYVLLIQCIYQPLFSQILPAERVVDWTIAGLKDTSTVDFITIDMSAFPISTDGSAPIDAIVSEVLNSVPQSGAILEFPDGSFLFNQSIQLKNNTIIRGQGAGNTVFFSQLNGLGHSIIVQGYSNSFDTTFLTETGFKDSNFIYIENYSLFSVGDWIQIIQNDTDFVTSAWALHTVGQIVQISAIEDNKCYLYSPLRMTFVIDRNPFIRKIQAVSNVGIQCLKILRLDNTAPNQSSNIFFQYAVNCWVDGVESENCTFSHIEAQNCSNLSITQSYFHHGFDYGEGGRAYGVLLHATTNECLIENNIFEHLRHSMILQSGANGNVFSFNYSTDPFWTTSSPQIPSNSSGDIVLHGNYPYANLFEQNICQNIVIDNSHGPNGPFNTLFRNLSKGFGIFFSSTNSPYQNIIGNDIPNTSFPYAIVNYYIQGEHHFLFGNNNKGSIHPEGTNILTDISYAYSEKPLFVPITQWSAIGTPNEMGIASIPSRDRFISNELFNGICNNITTSLVKAQTLLQSIQVYPNPFENELYIDFKDDIQYATLIHIASGLQLNIPIQKGQIRLSTYHFPHGMYILQCETRVGNYIRERIIKIKPL
jgi:hypothetical protein